ncbi:TIGR02757 family protein [Hymenobacter rubripertinctus]|uniref:TIGR02757 family protein n=1 Tax=Hymenobacter rubripertinctus TaxID=2029981 RepID=A0A418QXG7_9BACT|nr:TIGR02757 family protein [Hymenobacter rubripertinctus]RIY09841.1 TIGR02757 family protein [Hymenobacter rubripertinctus]
MNHAQVRALLDEKYRHYDQPGFITLDPISIPHQFSARADVEISGLFAALLAWGRRPTIISKCRELLARMDNAPHQFITQHHDEDLKKLLGFCHRTFCDTDLLYFVHWLRWYYQRHDSLEDAFLRGATQKERLENFHTLFFSLDDAPQRTRKHVATPARGSACKRVNMYLRWMVRPDPHGVDFGLWRRLSPADLLCPCDVHVERVGRRLGLLQRKQVDWLAVEELTAHLRTFDPQDPVKYDFALFGLGVEGEM